MGDAVLNLAKKLILLPSISPNDSGCQNILIERLKLIGFNIEPMNFYNTKNFWAWRGSIGKTIMFAGHTDVVTPGDIDKWNFPPFSATINNGYLYGRGASDMKGALAAMIISVERFIKKKPDYKGRISFLITSDEEGNGKYGTKKVVSILKKRNEMVDYCILGEPTSEIRLGDCIKNGRRGSMCAHLKVQGIQGHVAYPHLAKNPIHQVIPFMQDLLRLSLNDGHGIFPSSSIQVSHILSGDKKNNNVIPGNLEIIFNIRFSIFLGISKIQDLIIELIKKYSFKFVINWTVNAIPFYSNPSVLYNMLSKIIFFYTKLNTKLKTTGGTSDGRYLSIISKEIIEFGLKSSTIHQVNECVGISDLIVLSKIYEDLLFHVFDD